MDNLLPVVVCGDDASGGAALCERLADAPGHDRRRVRIANTSHSARSVQVLVAEAVTSKAAVLVVDAQGGVTFEARRQLHLLLAVGLQHVMLALNNMDGVDYDEATFKQAQQECDEVATHLRTAVLCVPISVGRGDNIDRPSPRMLWYSGPTLLQGLAAAYAGAPMDSSLLDPPKRESATQFESTIVWTADRPMLQSRSYLMRVGTTTVSGTVAPLKYRVDSRTMQPVPAKTLDSGDVGVCNLELDQPIAFDSAASRFELLDQDDQIIGVVRLHFALRRSHNVQWQALDINKSARAALMGQRPCVLWFTGLSGAGKSTIANLVEKRLHALGRHTYLLDGDNVRRGLNKDLGFTDADRVENIRRVAEVARLMYDAGLVVLVSFISPFRSERRMARSLVDEGEFIEVFVDTPLEVAESRDPKGLYAKARRGEIKNFTGVDSPYEAPEHAELRLDTTLLTAEDCAQEILRHLECMGIVG